MSVIKKLHYLG